MVLVIGNRDNWGRKLGASAIREGMKLAFFDMRAEKLIAKIHPDNARSLKAFLRSGFRAGKRNACDEVPGHELGALSPALARKPCGARLRHLHHRDSTRPGSGAWSSFERGSEVFELEHEIERAIVVDPWNVAEDVVTMNSKALLQVDDEELEVALVYPEDADDRAGKLSVCSGIGTAILGYKEGDAFSWRIPDRTCHIRIEKVLYQPEAAGDFHL
jgi:regulator of nucleoside diphosphate kinase